MSVKSVSLAGLLVLGVFTANAQTYWSTNPNLDCGKYGGANGAPMQLPPGLGAGGYACFATGIIPWYASGGGWASTILVSAPPSAPVGILLSFSDPDGSEVTLDFLYHGDSTVHADSGALKAIYANQPLQVSILGLHSQAPSYGSMAGGSVWFAALCPDPVTCSLVHAQLVYSALPSHPWSLSAPVVWDRLTCYGYSSVVIDDGSTNTASFVITNDDYDYQLPRAYTIKVYDSTGSLYSSATTKQIPLYGSYADLVRNVVPKLPSGPFKLQVTGSSWMAFEALQFQGPSATTLVAACEIPWSANTPNSMPGGSRHTSPEVWQRLLRYAAQ